MSMFLYSLNIDINVFDDVEPIIEPLKTQCFQRLVLLTRYYKSASYMINSLRQEKIVHISIALLIDLSDIMYISIFSF